jgi:ribonuclease HI
MPGMPINPYAIYVFCDASMDYDSKNTGGIGVVIEFPESVNLESIKKPIGRYEKANIERLELEAIIQGMRSLLDVFQNEREKLAGIGQIVFITDRLTLCDTDRINAYKVKEWRSRGWKTFENKPVKNADLIDEIDKLRIKINKLTRCNVRIQYARSKYNRRADKAAAIGKRGGLVKRSIQIKGMKIGRRKYSGPDVDYHRVSAGQELIVRVYKKDPLDDAWEISTEICEGELAECRLLVVADSDQESRLHRNHTYLIRVKEVFQYHVKVEDVFDEHS